MQLTENKCVNSPPSRGSTRQVGDLTTYDPTPTSSRTRIANCAVVLRYGQPRVLAEMHDRMPVEVYQLEKIGNARERVETDEDRCMRVCMNSRTNVLMHECITRAYACLFACRSMHIQLYL